MKSAKRKIMIIIQNELGVSEILLPMNSLSTNPEEMMRTSMMAIFLNL